MLPDMIPRAVARDRGLTRFFTGKECRYGHMSERFVASGACVACIEAYRAKHRSTTLPRYMPADTLNFGDRDGIKFATRTEAQAAFRYIEACGWHMQAVKALRADPSLMERYSAPLPTGQALEIAKARAERAVAELAELKRRAGK